MDGFVSAVLMDVGGTLWPDRWPSAESDLDIRLAAVRGILPAATRKLIVEVNHRLDASAATLTQDTDGIIREVLKDFGLTVDVVLATAVRKAMCLPVLGRIDLFPGAHELLAAIKESGLRCVIVTNAVVRDGECYRRDFDALGLPNYIDAIVSSVDVGFRKPHPRIFEVAVARAGCRADQCIMVGNSKRNDVEPAISLGMRAIQAAIEEPVPKGSAAHAIVASLREAETVLRAWTHAC